LPDAVRVFEKQEGEWCHLSNGPATGHSKSKLKVGVLGSECVGCFTCHPDSELLGVVVPGAWY
jgi:hypothetical protein